MPQLRKRKNKETFLEEVGKKIKEEKPVLSKNVSKKSPSTGTRKSSAAKNSNLNSEETKSPNVEFDKTESKDKKFVQSLKKDPILTSKTKTQKSSLAKVSKSHSKRKKSDSSASSDDEFCKSVSKNKKVPSSKKDLKLKPKIECSPNVKVKSSDTEYLLNSNDTGISSETLTDSIRTETKSDIAERASTSVNDVKSEEESSSSESEWEEVQDQCETASLDDYKPDIPKEGVEITIDCPDLKLKKRTKKEFDENEWIRLHINRIRKDVQISVHKTHLLCLFAHGMYMNKILNSDSMRAMALSLISDDIFSYTTGKKLDKIDVSGIEKIVTWFKGTFSYEYEKCLFLNLFSSLVRSFKTKKAMNASEYNLMFVVIARILGFKVRLCVSLYPVTYKASNLIKKPNGKRCSKKSTSVKEEKETKIESETNEKPTKTQQKIPKKPKQKKNLDVKTEKKITKENAGKMPRPRRSAGKSYKLSSDEDDGDDNDKDFEILDGDGSDDDFKKLPKVSSKSKRESQNRKKNRKVLSTDSEPSSPQSSAFESGNIICWSEIYLKQDKQWIPVECANTIINKPYDIEKLALKPVSYILAYDNNSYVKDVTRRYCNDYMTATVKLRIEPEWWEDTLEPFLPPNSVQNKAEEKKLEEMLVNKPLPNTVQGFKNHPLYALKRHLLKFEAIYPPDAPPVGFFKSEPVYARDCVHQLHSRETWLKEARVVKIGEEPYKIVKARPKWDRVAGVMKTDLPLEIFGHWQTQEYEPPTAVDGKVPRNEYGNVELFKSCMLPKGTVHLQLPGLNRVAKKLGIDCSAAVVGFDGHKGSVHAVFEGFVVCKEFKDTLIEAWEEDQENARKREEEKREKRIYGNWKKLIKGLLIRERIKLKYDTK